MFENASWDNPFGDQVQPQAPAPEPPLPYSPILELTELDLADAMGLAPDRVIESGEPLKRQHLNEDPAFREQLSEGKLSLFAPDTAAAMWPSGLIFDLSLGLESTREVLDRYNVSDADYERFLAHPLFRKELAETMRANQVEGVTFSRKCAALAEEALPDMFAIVKDPLVPAANRTDTWKHLAKLGKLEPNTKDTGGGTAPQVNIQINL